MTRTLSLRDQSFVSMLSAPAGGGGGGDATPSNTVYWEGNYSSSSGQPMVTSGVTIAGINVPIEIALREYGAGFSGFELQVYVNGALAIDLIADDWSGEVTFDVTNGDSIYMVAIGYSSNTVGRLRAFNTSDNDAQLGGNIVFTVAEL